MRRALVEMIHGAAFGFVVASGVLLIVGYPLALSFGLLAAAVGLALVAFATL
ncbi:MAG TPA: hypothetical protein VNN72_12420 [Polyangiaceae bacterium]|nr:hypothetical protein [Polyangiaceae bacterium]